MRVGVQLPEVEREVRWPELRAIALAAERSGYDSIWVGDHMLYRDDGRAERGPWDVWTLLAALAATTERVRLGPLVASTAFHPPGLVARMAAATQEISGGRFVLGLGAGWNEVEFVALGMDFHNRGKRTEEQITLLRALWTQPVVGSIWQPATLSRVVFPAPLGPRRAKTDERGTITSTPWTTSMRP